MDDKFISTNDFFILSRHTLPFITIILNNYNFC